jgi:predicted PurR-regulated permease PerM
LPRLHTSCSANGEALQTACRGAVAFTAVRFEPAFDAPQFLSILHCENILNLGVKRIPAMEDADQSSKLSASNDELLLLAVRIVCLGFLGYWSLILIRPFLTIIVWSIIIAVALYPIFDWLSAKLYGHRALAAVAVTILSLLVMLGPATWLALSLAETVRTLLARLGDGTLTFPPPSDAIKAWPLIGEKIYESWLLASTNLRALVIEAAPHLKPLGSSLLNAAGSIGINLLKFIVAVVISGFLLIPGPSLIHSIKNVLSRVAARGEEFVDLAGATIRNVSRGIIGIAILQALLAGVGLLFAGVPAAGLFSFLVLVLGIIQIGPSVILLPLIIWSWFVMDTKTAVLFTLYMVPVNLLDNILRPLVAKGLSTPMPVILLGVLGGTLVHGMIGLFVGPIVLSIGWQLLVVWIRDEPNAKKVVG